MISLSGLLQPLVGCQLSGFRGSQEGQDMGAVRNQQPIHLCFVVVEGVTLEQSHLVP